MGLATQPKIHRHKGEEDHGDDAVHGEKSGIQAAQVARRNQGMLKSKQEPDGSDAKPSHCPKMKQHAEPDQKCQHCQMHEACYLKGRGDAQCLGHAVEARCTVMIEVLHA